MQRVKENGHETQWIILEVDGKGRIVNVVR